MEGGRVGGREWAGVMKALSLRHWHLTQGRIPAPTERNPWDQGARCASLGFVRRPSLREILFGTVAVGL